MEGYKPVDEDRKDVDLMGVDEDDDDQTGHKMSGRSRNITISFSIISNIGCGSFVGFSVLIIVYALCKFNNYLTLNRYCCCFLKCWICLSFFLLALFFKSLAYAILPRLGAPRFNKACASRP